MNTTTITGNLVRDPDLRITPTGQTVTSFSVADNRRWADRTSGEWQESTTYLDIVAWGDLADNAARSLHKGDRVTVTGRIDQRSWETDSGEKRTRLELHATDVAASVRHATVTVTRTERPTAAEPAEAST